MMTSLSSFFSDNIWLFLIGSLVGITCSQVGSLLVLRKQSMMGDAISHTVLLGIVAAFLVSSSMAPIYMVPGAIAAGLLTAFFAEMIGSSKTMNGDGAIGITFTTLFAISIILLNFYAGDTHLDLDCVLYGELTYAPFDVWEWQGKDLGPRSFWILLFLSLVNSFLLWISYRPVQFASFDPVVARAQGVSIRWWNYFVMAVVSITTVLNIESVGAILVVAMLIVPATSGYLLAGSMFGMILIACVFSVLASFGGVYASAWLDASPGAAIAIAAGVLLSLVVAYQHRRHRMAS
jgi:manganese/zinc/iron transport system permease protein